MNVGTDRLELFIEALIFASEYALSTTEITVALNTSFEQNFDVRFIEDQVLSIQHKYAHPDFAIQLAQTCRCSS